jgi:hypothetical protein
MARAFRAECYGPGETVASPRPGDFVLIHGRDWGSRVIRWALRHGLRDRGGPRLAHWSHAALVVSFAGHIVDVGPRGVSLHHLGNYRDHEYHYVATAASAAQRLAAVRYARSCVGQPYARLGFAALALNTVAGLPCLAHSRGRHHCVSLVAHALARAGETFPRAPEAMTPADLARHYGVTPARSLPAIQTHTTTDEERIRWIPGCSR